MMYEYVSHNIKAHIGQRDFKTYFFYTWAQISKDIFNVSCMYILNWKIQQYIFYQPVQCWGILCKYVSVKEKWKDLFFSKFSEFEINIWDLQKCANKYFVKKINFIKI